ncbi:MAG: 3-deoxy-7-phosphoheptulonate synthase [Candidatus Dasytiphilus stammeri]
MKDLLKMPNALNHYNNIQNQLIITSPKELKKSYPCNDKLTLQISKFRKKISAIINGSDNRLLIICGPCSIHDPQAAIEYAKKLKYLSNQVHDKMYLIMRVYLEKPRTSIGWKGLINDPYRNNSCNIESGLKISRQLLLELTNIGIPLGTEALNLNTIPYLEDLYSWMSIGARTTESQPHREIVSGLSIPIGFKNTTDGNYHKAINAIITANVPHTFLSINSSGKLCVLQTRGNNQLHVILRGGDQKTNYDSETILQCVEAMKNAGLYPSIMVDCSHDNSKRDYRSQPEVAQSVIMQRRKGNNFIIGLMLESNLYEGNQLWNLPSEKIQYGISLTDACISWKTTEILLQDIYKTLQ